MATKTKLTAADEKLLAKLPKPGTENQTRTNPYSGAAFTLTPQEAVVCDWVLAQYNNGRPFCGVSTWDRAKYILLKLNPDAYFGLID